MTNFKFLREPPPSGGLTDYDQRHLVTYLRLLDAEVEGADWREVVRIVFASDPAIDSEHARLMYSSHLARAHWMRDSGFRHLLEK